MRNLMRLDEAIEKKIVKNLDKVDPNALFPKTMKKVILEPRITGVAELQEIYRQDFDYIFFKTRVGRDINLSMLAVGKEGNINTSVELSGRIGYLWCHACWSKINKLYSKRSNGITACAISEEELKLLFERNKSLKGFEFSTWLDESFIGLIAEDNYQAGTKRGIKFVRGREVFEKDLWHTTGVTKKGAFDYCPYIHICSPENIMVILNSKKEEGRWKLIPRKGLLK